MRPAGPGDDGDCRDAMGPEPMDLDNGIERQQFIAPKPQ
jgi:hypothetical protein